MAIHYNNPDTVKRLASETVRRPVARLKIEWTGNLIDTSLHVLNVSDEDKQRGTVEYPYINQVHDSATVSSFKWFHLSDYNVLNGEFYTMPIDGRNPAFQVGWRGSFNSDNNGNFTGRKPSIELGFEDRLFNILVVVGDNALKEYPVEFTVTLTDYQGVTSSVLVNNTNYPDGFDLSSCTWRIEITGINNINKMKIEINKWSHANTFVKIVEAYTGIIADYDSDDIVNLSILEETESSAGTLPVGNISYNELDLTLQNITNQYFPFNYKSTIRGHLTRNRKIVPYIGFTDDNGDEHLIPKGLYWTGEWNVSEQGSNATTTGRDRMGLLQDYTFSGFHENESSLIKCDGYKTDIKNDVDYTYWLNISVRELINRLLLYIRIKYMADLEFEIDSRLANVIIPVAFFKSEMSFFDLLKSIAQVSMSYIYMDTPTDAEILIAENRGNKNLRDILRIVKVDDAFQTSQPDRYISAKDYITRSHRENRDELANIVYVTVNKYEIAGDGKPAEVGGNFPKIKTYRDENSIGKYGAAEFEYPENKLIQVEELADEIGNNILNLFSSTHRSQELDTFGDTSLCILDAVEIPEYQEFDPVTNTVEVKVKDVYIVKRIETEYDGSLRQSITCRKGN